MQMHRAGNVTRAHRAARAYVDRGLARLQISAAKRSPDSLTRILLGRSGIYQRHIVVRSLDSAPDFVVGRHPLLLDPDREVRGRWHGRRHGITYFQSAALSPPTAQAAVEHRHLIVSVKAQSPPQACGA